MAYIAQVPKNEENQFGATSLTTPNPIPPQTSGSAGSGGSSGSNAAPGTGTSTQFGSNAAKLSDYLKANEPQVNEFGQKVADSLTQGYNQAKNSVDTGFGNFGQEVNKGYAQDNPDLINQAKTNPADFVKNQDNVKSFQDLYNNQYKGPQNFEGSDVYSGVNNDVNKALENASLVGNQSGLGSYLNNTMGVGGYSSPGIKNLDSALLQRSPDASKAIRDAADPYKGLNDYLSQKASEANASVGTAKDQANQIRQSAQNPFIGEGGVIPSFENGLQKTVSDRQNQAQQGNLALSHLLSGNTMTPEDLGSLGMTPEQYQQITGYGRTYYEHLPELSNYATGAKSPTDISVGNIASNDDYAKAAALGQLTGQNMSGFLNPAFASQAGTAPGQTGFDVNSALNWLKFMNTSSGRNPGGGAGGGGYHIV